MGNGYSCRQETDSSLSTSRESRPGNRDVTGRMENESAQHRAELLTCLEISLSVADEDFLEEVRGGDRSSTVQDEALRLLRMIPESRILRLFAETLKKHLHYRRLLGWAVDPIAYSEEFKN